jgi:MFS family permease
MFASPSPAPFVRDRFTLLAYFMLGYFAYTQAALGPAVPFLRAELDLSYTVAGLHFSALAIGMILAGLTAAEATVRWGRGTLFWGGGAGMLAGALLLIAGRSALATVGAAFIMGLLGTYLLASIPAMLSDRHGSRRATALTESNTFASAATILPPLLIGLGSQTGLGWGLAFVLAGIAWVVATVFNARVALPAAPEDNLPGQKAGRRPLPRDFWVLWVMVVVVVAVEWSMVAWGTDFLTSVVGLEPALASGLASAYFVAMLIGRFTGSRLTLRLDSQALLPAALGLAGTGFVIFWLAPIPALNVLGLFITGLGIANLFPLTLVLATSAAADQADQASARITLAAGIAILAAPQVLGAFADAVGLRGALSLVAILMAGAGLMIFLARRLAPSKAREFTPVA